MLNEANVIRSKEIVEYFQKEHDIRVNVTNEGNGPMVVIIYPLRSNVNIDRVTRIVAYFFCTNFETR